MLNRDFLNDVKNNIYKDEDSIAMLIPYMYKDVLYALHYHAEPELMKHFMAAIVKFKNADLSYEDILMELADATDDKFFSYDSVKDLIINLAFTASKIFQNYITWIPGEDSLQKALFTTCITRLFGSFKAAIILVNCGFFVEVTPISRMILEQLAWGCYLLQEQDVEKVKSSSPQSSVSCLKSLLGEKYGSLYGDLSAESHLNLKPNKAYGFGKYTKPVDGGSQTIIRSTSRAKNELIRLLPLLEAHGEVVWKGIQQFGISENDKHYFCDWHDFHIANVSLIKKILKGEVKITRMTIPT